MASRGEDGPPPWTEGACGVWVSRVPRGAAGTSSNAAGARPAHRAPCAARGGVDGWRRHVFDPAARRGSPRCRPPRPHPPRACTAHGPRATRPPSSRPAARRAGQRAGGGGRPRDRDTRRRPRPTGRGGRAVHRHTRTTALAAVPPRPRFAGRVASPRPPRAASASPASRAPLPLPVPPIPPGRRVNQPATHPPQPAAVPHSTHRLGGGGAGGALSCLGAAVCVCACGPAARGTTRRGACRGTASGRVGGPTR